MHLAARLGFLTVTACLLANSAIAETGPTMRIRGTIDTLDGQAMTVTSREGTKLPITLAESFSVLAVKALDPSAIQPGSYVGAASEIAADGELQALEILVFPEAARGTAEGHRDWDLKPGSTMTNATVAAASQRGSGRDVELAYPDGSKKVHVPTGVPIVTLVPAERADLKLGAPVFLTASKNAEGGLSATRVIVGKDGVAPPM